MGLTPTFKLVAHGKDITKIIQEHVQHIKLVDTTGFEADTVDIQLHDAGDDIVMPTVGAQLEVYLGYQETELQKLGHYIIDEVELHGPPHQVTLRGKSADMLKSLKAPKTRSWQHLSDATGHLGLNALLETIAGEHQLIPKLSEELQALSLHSLTQTHESDLHFLTRVARGVGAVTKPAAGHLLMFKKGLAKTLSGQLLPSLVMTTERVYRWSMTQHQRNSYNQITARYYDQGEAQEKRVNVGEGLPGLVIGQLFKNEQEAKLAAQAKLDEIKQGELNLTLELPGDPNLIAESKIDLSGIKAGVDGLWFIVSVTHELSGSGYRCSLSCNKSPLS